MGPHDAPGEEDHHTRSSARLVAALFVAASLSQASQYLLPFLYSVPASRGPDESIRSALDISPSLFSVLVGYAAGIPRAATQFLAGQAGSTRLVQRRPHLRVALLAAALSLQACGSLALAACRSSSSSWGVVAAQVAVGLGSGPLYPLSYALVARAFDSRRLGVPNGAVSTTAYCGPAVASLSVLVARTLGWRLAVRLVAGALALAAGLLVVVVSSVGETTTTSSSSGGASASSGALVRRRRTDDDGAKKLLSGASTTTTRGFLCGTADDDDDDRKHRDDPPVLSSATVATCGALAAAAGARYAAGYAVPAYVPLFFDALYPSRTEQFAACNAAAIFAAGSASALLGGALAARTVDTGMRSLPDKQGMLLVDEVYSHRGSSSWARPVVARVPSVARYLGVPIASCLLGGLCAAAVFIAGSFAAAIVALFAMQLAGEAWLAGAVAAVRVVPGLGPRRVDAALGVFYASATLVGCSNLLVLGAAFNADSLGEGGTLDRLRAVMVAAVAAPYVVAAGLFLVAARCAWLAQQRETIAKQSLDHHAESSPAADEAILPATDKTPLLGVVAVVQQDRRCCGSEPPSPKTNPFREDEDDEDGDADEFSL